MQLSRKLLAAIAVAVAIGAVGCSSPEPGEAPGVNAKSDKAYTKEDALAIKPKRAGSEGNGTAAPVDGEAGK
jgi:hypothetical protein